MRKRITLLVATTLLCSGCWSTASIKDARMVKAGAVQAPNFLLPSHGSSKVVIVRANLAMAPCAHRFKVDGYDVVTLRPGEKVEMYLNPGLHAISMDFSNLCGGEPVQTTVNVTKRGVVVHDEMKSGYYTLRDYPLGHG